MDLIKLFSGGFPLTIERLQFLQETYNKAITQMTTIYGLRDNEIGVLSGLVLSASGGGSVVSDGIVIYNGEIMEFRSGIALNTDFVIVDESITVPYNEDMNNDGDLDQKEADTTRYMTTAGQNIEGEQAIQVDFALNRLPNIQQIMPQIGEVKMWRGNSNNVPEGWRVMDEMNDKFPIGTGVSGNYAVGEEVGENEVVLTESEMPSHRHEGFTNFEGEHTHLTFNSNDQIGSGKPTTGNSAREGTGFHRTESAGNHFHSFNTNLKGGNQSHENRPSSIAFYFIEFIGF